MSADDNVKLWEQHLFGEFVAKNEDVSLETMVEDASVMHVPTQSGGRGKVELKPYYRDVFIPSLPDGLEHKVTNRVVTDDCIVEEALVRLVHTKRMEWFLPGVPPTGKKIEIDLVIVVEFRDGKMAAERIYWDQASVLRQVGRLEPPKETS
jgi:carboxymethylenebutenolidase